MSTTRDIAGALNFRSGLIPYANDAAANQATEAELRRTIKFPPDAGNGIRAINTAMENGGAGKELKQSTQAKHFNTTTKDFPEHAKDNELALDPPVSEAQRKAMFAAKSGKSTLGIPKSVGSEFANADPGGKLPFHAKDAQVNIVQSSGEWFWKFPGSSTKQGPYKSREEAEEAARQKGNAPRAADAKDEEIDEDNDKGTGKKIQNADPYAAEKDKDNAMQVHEKMNKEPSKKEDEKAMGAAAHVSMAKGRWGGRASEKAHATHSQKPPAER